MTKKMSAEAGAEYPYPYHKTKRVCGQYLPATQSQTISYKCNQFTKV